MLSKIFALFLFIALLPVFLVVALVVFLNDGSPVIFAQKRIGKDGKSFRFYKFRTMVKDAQKQKIRWKKQNPELWKEYEENNFKLKDDFRVTKIGKFLRKTSLDELPQLFNIMKGEMSFVGPRPILLREKQYYGENFKYYIQHKPGITGLWQVSGRSNTSFEDRIKFDCHYAENKSIFLDITIILKTFIVILARKGSY